MSIKAWIPNLLTLGNLSCGIMAILLLLDPPVGEPPYELMIWLVLGAFVFDFADGFVARLLKVSGPMGRELDSLADMVTFGVLPGVMVYFVLRHHPVEIFESGLTDLYVGEGGGSFAAKSLQQAFLPYIALLIPLFSALRLAKFNIDTRQSYGFLGLPTPANALLFMSIFLMFALDAAGGNVFDQAETVYSPLQPLSETLFQRFEFAPWLLGYLHHPLVLSVLTVVFSILLITDIPLLALKFQNTSIKDNWTRYILIIISVILLIWIWYRAVPLIIAVYFILSFFENRRVKAAGDHTQNAEQ